MDGRMSLCRPVVLSFCFRALSDIIILIIERTSTPLQPLSCARCQFFCCYFADKPRAKTSAQPPTNQIGLEHSRTLGPWDSRTLGL